MYLIRFLKVLFRVCLLLVIIFLLVFGIFHTPFIQNIAVKKTGAHFGYDAISRRIIIKPDFKGVVISVSGLDISDTTNQLDLKIQSLECRFSLKSLLNAQLHPEYLEVFRPSLITKKKPASNSGNIRIKETLAAVYGFFDSRVPDSLQRFELKDGNFDFVDSGIHDVNISLSRSLASTEKACIRSSCQIMHDNSSFPLKIDGQLNYTDGKICEAGIKAVFSRIPLIFFPWPSQFHATTGFFGSDSLRIDWKRNGTMLAMGKVRLRGAAFMLDAFDELKSYNISDAVVELETELLENAVDIRKFEISGRDYRLDAACFIPLTKGHKGMSLSVGSSFLNMDRLKKLYPSPVTPKWIDTRLLPLFSGGQARLNRLLIQGSFGRISAVDSRENAPALFLDIDVKGIDIADFGGGLESGNVSANVLLKDGRLVISGINGKIGSSEVKDAVYDYENTYSRESIENWMVSGRFTADDLHKIASSGLSPEIVQDIAAGIKKTDGFLEGDIAFSYHPSWDFIRIDKGSVSSDSFYIDHCLAEYPVDLKKIRVVFEKDGVAKLMLGGKWGKSPVNMAGNADIFQGNFNFKGSGILSSADLFDLIGKKNGKADFSLKGDQPVVFNASASEWKWNFTADADLEGFSGHFHDLVLPDIKKRATLKIGCSSKPDGGWDLKKLELGIGSGQISLLESSSLESFRQIFFFLKDFDFGRLGISHKKSGVSITGRADGSLKVMAGEKGSPVPGIYGKIAVFDAGIIIPGLPLENTGRGEVEFNGQRAEIRDFMIGLGGNVITVSGFLKGWDGLKGDIRINSESLVLPAFKLKSGGDEFFPVFENDFARNSDLKISIGVKKGRSALMNFGFFKADCVFKNGYLDVKNAGFDFDKGEMRFRASQSIKQKHSVRGRGYIKFVRQDLRELFTYLDSEDSMARLDNACLTADSYFYFSGRNRRELISNLGGYARISLDDGIIRNSSVIFSILSMLNMEKIFYERPVKLSKDGFYFNSLRAGFNIKNGIFSTTDLVMKSPVISIGAAGYMDYNDRSLDLDIVAAPLVTIDRIVSNLPFLGYILTGPDRALLSYYFKVKGPVKSPETRYLPLQKIPHSIAGYFKRIFMTPGRIAEEFEDLRDFFTGHQDE